MREDLGERGDLTSCALVPADQPGRAAVAVREAGVVAGLAAAELTLAEYAGSVKSPAKFASNFQDGDRVPPRTMIATIEAPARTLLMAERVFLNILGRLCGIATATRKYVDAVAGTQAHIYDTRKTTPGWRRLEKYAVRCGGGRNHRTGLFDAVLIKDNHLAFGGAADGQSHFTPAEAVTRARSYLSERGIRPSEAMIEVEVDTLEQLRLVLPAQPDIVLLDNMSPETLREAVAIRGQLNPDVQLEASGGITIDNVRTIAETGVERISIGALTHSSRWLDVGLDWLD
jgi:nicotinate-nucleotide pyrophosphorylase (carboxylating)